MPEVLKNQQNTCRQWSSNHKSNLEFYCSRTNVLMFHTMVSAEMLW